MPDEISAATAELVAKIKNPLSDEQKLVVARTLQRLEQLATQGVIATAEQIDQVKVEARGCYATLASIGDAAAAEVTTLFTDKLIQVALALTGKLLTLA